MTTLSAPAVRRLPRPGATAVSMLRLARREARRGLPDALTPAELVIPLCALAAGPLGIAVARWLPWPGRHQRHRRRLLVAGVLVAAATLIAGMLQLP